MPSPAASAATRESHYVQSLERGLSVIPAFGPDTAELTLSEVARLTGLTRAAARRFLLTLVDLEALTRQVHESSSMSVLDGTDIVYVARVPTSRIMTVAINVGTRFPAYATSMGRVLLAGLDDAALEEHLAGLDLEQFTDRTVATHDELRAGPPESGGRVRAGRPGAGVRSAVAGRAGAQPRGQGRRRGQRLLAHQPGQRRAAARGVPPTAAAGGPGDRAGPSQSQ